MNALGGIARVDKRPQEALELLALSFVIVTQIGHAKAEQAQNHLMALLVEQKYTEEQIRELLEQVSGAYQKDGGRELIENALARLGDTDN